MPIIELVFQLGIVSTIVSRLDWSKAQITVTKIKTMFPN